MDRRLTIELRNKHGLAVNHKKVLRIMRELNLFGTHKPKGYRSYRGTVGKVAANIINREFDATGVNQKWVTDITEFEVRIRNYTYHQ